jgi:tetratricopeptide (TPR) repeat protein
MKLGAVLQEQSKYEESLLVFQEILKRAPMYPEANFYAGTAYFALNRYDEAIAAFQKELTGNSTDKRARFNLALAYTVKDRHFEAIQQLQTLLTQDPGNAMYLYQLATVYKTATRKTAEHLAELQPDSAYTHALQGEAFADGERFDQAIMEYQEVLKKQPAFPGIHLAIGEVYWRKKQYPEARQHIELALQEDPNQPLANYYMGDILVTQNAHAQAVPHLQVIIAAYPQVARAYFLLGKCHMSSGDLPKAREVFAKALELDPRYQEVHFQLHLLYARLGNKAESQKELEIVKKLQQEDSREMQENTVKALPQTANP